MPKSVRAVTWTPSLCIGETYMYHWYLMGRKGQLCRLLVIGRRLGSVAVEFADGYKAVTMAKALRPLPPGYTPQPRLDFGGQQ